VSFSPKGEKVGDSSDEGATRDLDYGAPALFPCGRHDTNLDYGAPAVFPCGRHDADLDYGAPAVFPCGRHDADPKTKTPAQNQPPPAPPRTASAPESPIPPG
jgi:hypothetical protein